MPGGRGYELLQSFNEREGVDCNRRSGMSAVERSDTSLGKTSPLREVCSVQDVRVST